MVAAPFAVSYKVTRLDPTATEGNWWETPLEHPLPCGFVTLPSSCSFETAATTDAVLTALITIWMENYVSEGKLGIISRDDCLLYIIKRLSGMTGASRDIGELSTKKKTRCDMTMMYTNVPLVIVEEEWEDIRYASNDLKKIFQWLPHHNDLPFVFGLAFTKSEFQIYLMTADAGWKLRKPIVSANIDLTDDRAECLLYAVNIARVIKHFIEVECFTSQSAMQYSKWIRQDSKEIRISASFVENRYAVNEDFGKYEYMKDFYNTLSLHNIRHIERFVGKNPCNDNTLTIRLGPVGIQVKPRSIEEARTAFRHVMRCMLALHKKAQYMHCDLRWPNIILVGTKWFVIDCTECIAINAPENDLIAVSQSINESYNFCPDLPWSKRHDYYQFGKLIETCDHWYDESFPEIWQSSAKTLCDKKTLTISDEDMKTIAGHFLKEKTIEENAVNSASANKEKDVTAAATIAVAEEDEDDEDDDEDDEDAPPVKVQKQAPMGQSTPAPGAQNKNHNDNQQKPQGGHKSVHNKHQSQGQSSQSGQKGPQSGQKSRPSGKKGPRGVMVFSRQ